MKKIVSLFKRDYEGTRLVYDEVVEGAEWVMNGEGYPTEKVDGTSCLYKNGVLYKRYDRKVSKQAKKKTKDFRAEDFKPAPDGWISAEDNPNFYTGHWPGWLAISDGPDDQWHREGLANTQSQGDMEEGTYELIGPKIQGNPYQLANHILHKHGEPLTIQFDEDVPRDFAGLKQWLTEHELEGIVWHHSDGRKVKIKRRDFGLVWPPEA